MIEKESIYTLVSDERGYEKTLEIRYEADTLAFLIDGKELFGGDWSSNFHKILNRAMEMWQIYFIPEYEE